jgi:hypothetical protein
MTDKEIEILTLVYALGDAIQVKDWTLARVIWDRLLLCHAPLADMQPHLSTVLKNQEAMIQMAERQSTKIH